MHKRDKGGIGETVACNHLVGLGFEVIGRNYRKSWGELDIIAIKDGALHFIEVKSVTFIPVDNVSTYKPEDNVHGLKARHIRKMIQTYIWEKNVSPDTSFQFHVACVYLDFDKRTARVRMMMNLVI